MAVLCEAISVVVPVSVLEGALPGGVAAYAGAVPNATFVSDGTVTRVGFLEPALMQDWVARLVSAGLRPVEDGRCVDVAVVDQVRGLPVPCDWLDTTSDGTVRIAWWAGSDPGEVVVPHGWRRGQSEHLFSVELPDLVRYDAHEADGVQTLRDDRTGRVLRRPVARAGEGQDPPA
jgi:hypothetical protein